MTELSFIYLNNKIDKNDKNNKNNKNNKNDKNNKKKMLKAEHHSKNQNAMQNNMI